MKCRDRVAGSVRRGTARLPSLFVPRGRRRAAHTEHYALNLTNAAKQGLELREYIEQQEIDAAQR
jgi:hypothetical protein